MQTRRLLLEPWDDAYFDDYIELLQDDETMRHLGGARTRERAVEQYEWYVRHVAEHRFGPRWLIERDTGRWAGLVGLRYLPDEWGDPNDVEVGWILAPHARGKGYAEEAARAMLEYAFDALGLETVIARTASANAPSVRICEKLGMELEGESEDGRWRVYRLARP